jgi:hypothetical protein
MNPIAALMLVETIEQDRRRELGRRFTSLDVNVVQPAPRSRSRSLSDFLGSIARRAFQGLNQPV